MCTNNININSMLYAQPINFHYNSNIKSPFVICITIKANLNQFISFHKFGA